MGVRDILSEVRSAVVAEWFESTMKEYSAKTAAVYTGVGDRFSNPVGTTFLKAMEAVVGYLADGTADRDRIRSQLDEVVKIRALQNISPSDALTFLFRLKDILLRHLGRKLNDENARELLNIETEIDRFSQDSFDTYVRCREKLYELRNKEVRDQARILLKRANIEYSFDSKEPCSSCN